MSSIVQLMSLLAKLLPFVLSEWESLGKPFVQSLINTIPSPDLKLALSDELIAVDKFIQDEAAKAQA